MRIQGFDTGTAENFSEEFNFPLSPEGLLAWAKKDDGDCGVFFKGTVAHFMEHKHGASFVLTEVATYFGDLQTLGFIFKD